jgi:hypothetical protein
MAAGRSLTGQSVHVPFGNVDRVWAMFISYRDHRVFEMLERLHPEVRWVRPGPTEYRGHDGVRQMLGELEEATGGYSIRLHEVTEPEPGLVVAEGEVTLRRTHGRTRATWLVELSEGLVTRVETVLPESGGGAR